MINIPGHVRRAISRLLSVLILHIVFEFILILIFLLFFFPPFAPCRTAYAAVTAKTVSGIHETMLPVEKSVSVFYERMPEGFGEVSGLRNVGNAGGSVVVKG
jgi:hypothetical protein